MTCEHCCVSAPRRGGGVMTFDTFADAMATACDYGAYVMIGGGEPTIHREFRRFVEHAVGAARDGGLGGVSLGVVTNGKLKRQALWLVELAEELGSEILSPELSLDQYHDPIDPVVVAAFTQFGRTASRRTFGLGYNPAIRTNGDKTIPVGRAVKLLGYAKQPDVVCCCEDWFVKPNGDVRQCGCDDSPVIGRVGRHFDPKPCTSICCWKSDEYREALAELERDEEDDDAEDVQDEAAHAAAP